MIKILFLAANPTNTARLRLDEESRAIDQALRQAEYRDKFEIAQHWAVRVADLQGYLLRHKPDIVHFSGHGGQSSEIILEDSSGESHPVSTRALSTLFSVLKDNIRCVVLNACYSEQQARAIAEYIDCVIGMSRAIGDKAAISFATAFYQALGYGRDVQTAFDLGCVQIDMENLNEQDTPKLLIIKSDPKTIVFVRDVADKFDRAQSEFFNVKGRETVQRWGQKWTHNEGWDWHALGQALEHYTDAVRWDPTHQHPWTNLAYVYHLIGQKQQARECLRESYDLASPGPNHPGRNYKRVKKAVDNDCHLTSAYKVHRPPVPSWFRESYERFLGRGFVATLKVLRRS